jgi:hypothetical protein
MIHAPPTNALHKIQLNHKANCKNMSVHNELKTHYLCLKWCRHGLSAMLCASFERSGVDIRSVRKGMKEPVTNTITGASFLPLRSLAPGGLYMSKKFRGCNNKTVMSSYFIKLLIACCRYLHFPDCIMNVRHDAAEARAHLTAIRDSNVDIPSKKVAESDLVARRKSQVSSQN